MAQDIRELLKHYNDKSSVLNEGHQDRFLQKLDTAFPETKPSKVNYKWLYAVASVMLLLGISYGVYNNMPLTSDVDEPINSTETVTELRPLGNVSPSLKKIEDYYLANINLELSKIQVTPENKELLNGYIKQLETLNREYVTLSDDLNSSGPSEATINALINNLKLRLNLLYRLKEQLQQFKESKTDNKL